MQDQRDERSLAKEAALKELHTSELAGMDDGPEYFQTRYSQEYDLLQIAKKDMEDLKVRHAAAVKRKKMIVERLCNLKDEIEEAKSPIIKLSKTLDKKAWESAEVEILSHFGLADSIVVMLKTEGFDTIGRIMEDSDWQNIPGVGEATQEKVTSACAEMIDNFNAKLDELQKIKEEQEGKEE